jgi:hypothetical protein
MSTKTVEKLEGMRAIVAEEFGGYLRNCRPLDRRAGRRRGTPHGWLRGRHHRGRCWWRHSERCARGLGAGRQPHHAWAVITELLKSGQVKPIVAKIFSLEDAAEALRYLIEGRPFGRVLVAILRAGIACAVHTHLAGTGSRRKGYHEADTYHPRDVPRHRLHQRPGRASTGGGACSCPAAVRSRYTRTKYLAGSTSSCSELS